MRPHFRKLVLAIDQGTTSTRCITFDGLGKPVHRFRKEFPQIYPLPGWVEHDPESIFKSVVECIDGLNLSSFDSIEAIGITNQRESVVAWERGTGRPLHNAIVWLDTRTHELVKDEIAHPEGAQRYRKLTGLPVSTYFSALKMKWLIENITSVREAIRTDSCCFGTIDSYLAYRLTGCKVHVTDCTNASRYNLMNLSSLQWSTEICEHLGIPVSTLPRIVSSSETIGRVDPSVVPALGSVPITSLIGDQHAALLGHGCVAEGQCKITYGTGSFLLMNTGLNRKESPSGSLLTTLAYKLGPDAPAVYALEGSVASAGRSVIWAKENLRIGDDLDEFNQYASSVPHTCGVTFVPAFSGLFAPYWRDDARAIIVGMSLRANFRHIARAIVEATALQCADVVNVLKKEGDIEENFHSIVTDGGMTKSDLLMQIQSDLLNTVIMRNRMTESTAFGAAYAAGLAIGFWETKPSENPIISLIESQPGADIFIPQMTGDERDKIFARWNDAVARSFDLAQFNNQSP